MITLDEQRVFYTNKIQFSLNRLAFFSHYSIVEVPSKDFKPTQSVPGALSFYCVASDKSYFLVNNSDLKEESFKIVSDVSDYIILKLAFRSVNRYFNSGRIGGPIEQIIESKSNIFSLEFDVKEYKSDSSFYISTIGHEYRIIKNSEDLQADKFLTEDNSISYFMEDGAVRLELKNRKGSNSKSFNSTFAAVTNNGNIDYIKKTKSYNLQNIFKIFSKDFASCFEVLQLEKIDMFHVENFENAKKWDDMFASFLSKISFIDKTGIIRKEDVESVIQNEIISFRRTSASAIDRNKRSAGIKDFVFADNSDYSIITVFEKDFYKEREDKYEASLNNQHLTVEENKLIDKNKLRTCLTELFIKYTIKEEIDISEVIKGFTYFDNNASDKNIYLKNGKLENVTDFDAATFNNIRTFSWKEVERFVLFDNEDGKTVYYIYKTPYFLLGDELSPDQLEGRRQAANPFFNFLRGINVTPTGRERAYFSSGFVSNSIGFIQQTISAATYLYCYKKYSVDATGVFVPEVFSEEDYDKIARMLACPFIKNLDQYSIEGIGFKWFSELLYLKEKSDSE